MVILFLISQINIDIGRFKGTDEFRLCEVYISIPYSELSYKKEKDGFKADFKLRMSINTSDTQPVPTQNEAGAVVQEFSKVSYINSYEEAEAHNLQVLDQIDLFLKPGKYAMKLEVIPESVSIEKPLEIDPVPSGLYLSDIQFATSIEPADEVQPQSGKFVKNGVKIIPNPQCLYGEKYTILYAYTEIYNLTQGGATSNSNYEVKYNIFSETGESLYTMPEKSLPSISKDITEVGSVNVSAFKEGAYILKIDITQNDKSVAREKKFWVIKELTEEDKFTTEELKYYQEIKYIASPEDIKFYNKLSDKAKEAYLIRFWKKVGRPVLDSLIKRIKYADDNFSYTEKQGRDSDRGRIYIKYGKPNEVEKIQFDPTYQPSERWAYFGHGGIVFIFVDKLGDGRYGLMYSNIQDEPTVPDYMKWINPEILP